MSRIKYGIVGASGIARRRAMPAFGICQHSSLAAVCSRSMQRATALAEQFGATRAYDDLGMMLAHVDAVYVATPVHCHLEDARKMLAAGKHLLLEKPLARTVAEAREILALVAPGTFAMEGYMMKFHPAHAEIRKAVQAGSIGSVVQGKTWLLVSGHSRSMAAMPRARGWRCLARCGKSSRRSSALDSWTDPID